MFAAIDLQVALIAVVCLAAGLGLGYLTWWFWQSAQPESPALAALEVMSERRYERADADERTQILESARIDPLSVPPLTRRQPKGRKGGNDDNEPDHGDDEFYDEWTDLGPIDPLLRG
jgi:hypothetical protein